MSYLDYKSKEEREKILAEQKEKSPKTLHTVVSIIYIGAIVLSSPLILWSLVYGYGLLIMAICTIASIIISRILINNNNLPIGYVVLFAVPLVTWLFVIQ